MLDAIAELFYRTTETDAGRGTAQNEKEIDMPKTIEPMTEKQIAELKTEIAKHGTDLKSFAPAIGMTYTSLYYKMHGMTDWTLTEIKTVKKELGLSDRALFRIFFNDGTKEEGKR